MLHYFFKLNGTLCNFFEKRFKKKRNLLRSKILSKQTFKIADVGGGKKPFKSRFSNIFSELEIKPKLYSGFDIDIHEFAKAPNGAYTDFHKLDLNSKSLEPQYYEKYDLVVCLNTLEHTKDNRIAIQNLVDLCKPGGHLIIRQPCEYAMFAIINKILPHKIANFLLFFVYPGKRGIDGFKAYYNMCSPNKFEQVFESNRCEVVEVNKIYHNDIFNFFLPLYILWRFVTILQYIFIEDYCESFEMIIRKKQCTSDDN